MAPTSLTETEIKTLIAAFESAETPFAFHILTKQTHQVNYEVMADKCGYKSSKVARDMWGRLKKKLESTSSQAGKSNAKGANPKKRPRAGKTLLFADDEEAGPPAKRLRTSEEKEVKSEEEE